MYQRLLPLFFILISSLARAQALQEFYLDDWQPKTITRPDYVVTPETEDPATATVSVSFNDTVSKVSKYVYGNNGVNWAGLMNNNAALMSHIKKLQPHVIRWPGGNLSQEYFWDRTENQRPDDLPPDFDFRVLSAGMNTANWSMNQNDYYELLEKTNSVGCICVNYAYARYGTSEDPVAKAAHYAADWVRYDNGRTKLWELGNENMGPWEAGYEINTEYNKDGQPKIISGDLYGRHSRVFVDSMKAAAAEIGHDIKIGFVVEGGPVTWNEVMRDWNKKMLPENADIADFLIVHSYYTPHNENSSVATILNSPVQTKGYKDYVLDNLKTYGNRDNVPIALTEWNIFAVGSKQAVSYINGMHAALIFGETIKNEYGQANRWDLMNGWSNGDDHGLFARSDEPGMAYGDPHAPYYYMYFFQKYFGDVIVNSTVAGSSVVKSYASAFSSGQCGIVLVNKYTQKQVVTIDLKDMPQAKSYYRYVLTGGSDNGDFSRQVFVNGVGPTKVAGGPSNFESIKAYGKTINEKPKIELPPLSVTYVLVTADSIAPVTSSALLKQEQVNVFPNPGDGRITISSPGFRYSEIEVINMAGQKVFQQAVEQNNGEYHRLNLKLQAGMYYIVLSDKTKRASKKIIIQ